MSCLYADAVHGPHRAGMPISAIGAYLPAYAFALGKVLLAYEPWEQVQDYVEKTGLVAYTQHTLTKPDQLKAELEQVRQQGYAVSQSEYMREWSAVAAPVRGHAGAVVASIGAGVSASRYPMLSNELIASVISTANSLSKIIWLYASPGGCFRANRHPVDYLQVFTTKTQMRKETLRDLCMLRGSNPKI